MIAKTLLRDGIATLREAGVPDPVRDARRLLSYCADVDASRLTLFLDEDLTKTLTGVKVMGDFDIAIRKRAKRVPVSQIVGSREFFGRRFHVTGDVLDPRPDTEALITVALSEPFEQVLDLGTGSGCILVSLLAERPDASGFGTDISAAALSVAQKNCFAHDVHGRATLHVGAWFEAVSGSYDLIISNPPYIAADEMDDLQPEVRLYEPRIALTDGADGLTAYRKITAGAPDHLTPGGRLIVEIGPTQAGAVSDMMRDAGLTEISVRQDLDGRDRVVSGRKPR